VLLISFVGIVSSAEEVSEGVEGAKLCLKDKLGNNCGSSKSTEQVAWSLLAMAGDSGVRGDCKSALVGLKKDDCWGKTDSGSCDLKSTSLAILGLNQAGSNVNDAVDWLISKRGVASGLKWFLEIDSNNATKCTINYGSDVIVNVGDNKKLTGSSNCLKPSSDGYFLEIEDDCLEKNFSISCEKDFVSTLFYKKTGYDIYYVSGETHLASAYGKTNEKVEAYCFESSGNCDYEGSLWASLALARMGKDVKPYLAYLSAMVDEPVNERFLSYVFLYMLMGDDESYSRLVEEQVGGKFWDKTGNKIYDTGFVLLALQGLNSDEVNSAKEYLLSVQDDNGCWSNILDTSLVLYALNPTEAVPSVIGEPSLVCSKFCVPSGSCALSDILDGSCSSLGSVCCKQNILEETCDDKRGIVCSGSQSCSGIEVVASDTNYCCLDSCIVVSSGDECKSAGYNCKSDCLSDEEEVFGYDCGTGLICCSEKESSFYWIWILVLLILIVLVIIGIVLRKKLRKWWFDLSHRVKVDKQNNVRRGPPIQPPVMPVNYGQRISPRRVPPKGAIRQPVLRRKEDKEFDDVMKKLKSMSE